MLKGLKIDHNGKSVICYIEDFSDELKSEIRSQLSGIYNGFHMVDEDPIFYSYKYTLNLFLYEFDKKSSNIKKGMIGELLSHVLLNIISKKLTSISVYKNKEENSIKKGFDILYYDKHNNSLWYTEVKSGKGKSTKYNKVLLNRSKNGISTMLQSKRQKLWDSALIDLQLVIKNGINHKKIKNLLQMDSPVSISSNDKKNVILISVLYYDIKDMILLKSIEDFCKKTIKEDLFNDVIVFSIQKNTYSKVITFLKKEAKT